MEANRKITEGLLNNESFFKDPFFNRFKLRHAPEPLELDGGIKKNYFFPTLYADVSCAIGIFLCDYDKAEKILPHKKIWPVRMTKGRALVTLSCYQYKNVMGVAPYNEIAATIPVMCDAPFDLPVLPMLASGLFPGMGFYCFAMPVTSRENQIRGNRIWGLPKVTQKIDINTDQSYCTTTAYEDDGEAYISLKVPTNGKRQNFDVSADLFTNLNGKYYASRTYFKGAFNVNKYMDLLFKKNKPSPEKYLTLGSGPSAKVFHELGIEEHPFQFRYAEKMNAAFDLPYKEVRL
jgi:hypothetical protein